MIGYLHGFLGTPEVWGEIDGVAIALSPIEATWDAQLASLARALGPVDAVVGYSLGARLALGLVASGRVPRAVLIGVNPGIDDADRPARRAADAVWAHRFRTEPLGDVLDAWEAQPLFATQARVSERVRAARRLRRLWLDPEQLARNLEVLGLAEMPDYRSSVDDRVHLIAGADDAKFLSIARSLSAPLDVIPEAGHDVLLEQPSAAHAAIARALG